MEQETLEEAAQRIFNGFGDITKPSAIKRALELVKWQQEQDNNLYSDEDMKIAFDSNIKDWISFEEFIEQFKNK